MSGHTGPANGAEDPTTQIHDEIAVTDVPREVREELTILFGSPTAAVSAAADDQQTPTVAPSYSSTDTSGIGDVDDTSEVESIVTVDTGADATSFIGDPLLAEGVGGDVVQIIEDQPELVVIDADEMDRVVIVDDDRPDPTFEERQRRRARRDRLKRVKWLKLTALVVVLVFVVLLVLASPLFAIRAVTFDGVVYTATETIDDVTDSLKGSSVFTVDTDKARSLLLSDPWVADVRITTSLSGRAIVEVAERVPVVWYAGDDQKARVIDARGHVITVLPGWPTKYLQVRGTGASLDAGAMADPAYRAAAQLVLALPDEVRPKVTSLDLNAAGEISMNLKSGTVVRFGPPTDLQNKLVAVIVLLRRQDPSTLAVIDVSTGEATVQTR